MAGSNTVYYQTTRISQEGEIHSNYALAEDIDCCISAFKQTEPQQGDLLSIWFKEGHEYETDTVPTKEHGGYGLPYPHVDALYILDDDKLKLLSLSPDMRTEYFLR